MNKYPQHKPSNPLGHSPNKCSYSDSELFQTLRKFLSGRPPIPSQRDHKFQYGTKTNQIYHPSKHKQNRYDIFPNDRHKIQAKHVKTNAIEETESNDPESSEEGEGDYQVNHIDKHSKNE